MSNTGGPDHWFDRLATRGTRRQALKAGLAGAAALMLPALRPAPGLAEDFVIAVGPCFTGCKAFTHQTYNTAKTACVNTYTGTGQSFVVGYYFATAGIFGGAAGYYAATREYHGCLDTAMMQQKLSQFDCSQADCSGFNPKQPGGPCATCNNNCCTCANVPLGYICCFYDCNDPNHNCCGS
jgi:hypothetical protein